MAAAMRKIEKRSKEIHQEFILTTKQNNKNRFSGVLSMSL